MPFNKSAISTSAVGNFNFTVEIQSVLGGDSISLKLPVDAIKGLNDAKTNIMRFRGSGNSNTSLTPYAGLSTAGTVTLEGTFLFDLNDVKELQKWRDEVKGKKPVATVAGQYRNLVVTSDSVDTSSEPITLVNCLCTGLSISDFDINSPAISNWTLEVEFQDMGV